MPTYEVTTLEPKADAMLDDMENGHLIEKTIKAVTRIEKKPLQFGCMKGLVLYIADDFDAPLDDFEEYM